MRRRLLILILSFAVASPVALARPVETPLPTAQNLAQEARAAQQQGLPLILLVSLTGCPYCEEVRKLHLAPLAKTGFIVRQIHHDRDTALIGFDGTPTTQKIFAKTLKLKVAPTVYFFDAQGVQLAEPIVGALHEDFYGDYLGEALDTAKKKLAARR